ncbi:putative acetyltransferase [Acorus calamus]|uniref:Acetyltransferase n=1 Tax=Acorus calamus TaxID=4465 RepID=A0AAV9FEL6_ACOCL|nr:putative acetyltransferase [Acorus calamus]
MGGTAAATTNEEVRCISTWTIRPSRGGDEGSDGQQQHMTLWDLRILTFGYIQKGLLFASPPQQQELVSGLRSSLSRALDHYPPLAGRLSTTKHDNGSVSISIDCNGQGAEFIHSAAHRCAMNHSVCDGTSFWHFLNAWSKIFASPAATTIPEPVLDRWFPESIDPRIHLPFTDLSDLITARPLPPPLQETIIHFTRESIAKLKSTANQETRTTTTTHTISSFQAVLTHLWERYVGACNLLIGSSPRFNMYGNDFGWGRPVAVRSSASNKMDGCVRVYEGGVEGSMDLEISLVPGTMSVLMDDIKFMESVHQVWRVSSGLGRLLCKLCKNVKAGVSLNFKP